MQQIVVTQKNGVDLAESQTIGINPENIVTTRDVNGVCEILYAEVLDRRMKPILYLTTNTKAVIDALITGGLKDLTVYDLGLGSTSTLSVANKFFVSAEESVQVIGGAKTACRKVKYVEGAFNVKSIYVSTALASIADAVVTTTTTTAAATTTTTAAPTTTTTTA